MATDMAVELQIRCGMAYCNVYQVGEYIPILRGSITIPLVDTPERHGAPLKSVWEAVVGGSVGR